MNLGELNKSEMIELNKQIEDFLNLIDKILYDPISGKSYTVSKITDDGSFEIEKLEESNNE